MAGVLKHKGYVGSVEFDLNEQLLHGKIEAVNDLVTYEAKDIAGLKAAFEEAVDDYLATCEEQGKSPDKPMNGSFNIRIGEELHKKVYLMSLEKGCSINDVIKQSVANYIDGKGKSAPLKIKDDIYLNMENIVSIKCDDECLLIGLNGGHPFYRVFVGEHDVELEAHAGVEVNEFHRIKRQITEYRGQ